MLPNSVSSDAYFDTSKLYTIKNVWFKIGYLSYTFEQSHSGHYLQYLFDGSYNSDYQYYEPDNKWRNSVLWEINPVPDEEGPYYTLRNKGLDFGFMSVSEQKSPSGFYVEHLYSNAYDKEKKMYEKGEKFRDRMLWIISVNKDGSYSLINKYLNGVLSFTRKRAKSGHYLQVLFGKRYEAGKEKYGNGGIWEKTICWDIKEGKK